MIPLFKVAMKPLLTLMSKPINDVLQSGYITQGTQVDLFETKLQEYFQNPYVLTLNSATAGLTLALRLLKQRDPSFDWPGFDVTTDIVLTPALTCFATTIVYISSNGAKLRWLDVDLKTANISLDDVKQKLNEHTKVIYLVHWGGNPVDLDRLDDICNKHKETYGFKPMVVEDCDLDSIWSRIQRTKTRISSKYLCVFITSHKVVDNWRWRNYYITESNFV